MLPDEPLPIVPPAIEPPVPDIVVFPPGVAEAVEGEVPMFSIEDNAVLDSIILSNPMLSMLEAEANAYKAKAEMDKKMSLPMFGIGLQYSIMAKNSEEMARMSGMSNMNGMDMVMPMIKISIPIFRRNITPSSGRAGITVRQAN